MGQRTPARRKLPAAAAHDLGQPEHYVTKLYLFNLIIHYNVIPTQKTTFDFIFMYTYHVFPSADLCLHLHTFNCHLSSNVKGL